MRATRCWRGLSTPCQHRSSAGTTRPTPAAHVLAGRAHPTTPATPPRRCTGHVGLVTFSKYLLVHPHAIGPVRQVIRFGWATPSDMNRKSHLPLRLAHARVIDILWNSDRARGRPQLAAPSPGHRSIVRTEAALTGSSPWAGYRFMAAIRDPRHGHIVDRRTSEASRSSACSVQDRHRHPGALAAGSTAGNISLAHRPPTGHRGQVENVG